HPFAFVSLVAVALGCGASQPPHVTPRAAPQPVLPAPPWETRGSVAEGYEAKRPVPAPVLIRNATLMLATGKTIARGSILLVAGKIAAISEGEGTAPAEGATVIDGTGKFVTPGVIDTHSHLGVYPMPYVAAHEDGNEMVDPATPQAQSVDAFW